RGHVCGVDVGPLVERGSEIVVGAGIATSIGWAGRGSSWIGAVKCIGKIVQCRIQLGVLVGQIEIMIVDRYLIKRIQELGVTAIDRLGSRRLGPKGSRRIGITCRGCTCSCNELAGPRHARALYTDCLDLAEPR